LRSADNIIVLNNDGRIAEQGSFDQLNANRGYVQSLLLEERKKSRQEQGETYTPSKDTSEPREEPGTAVLDSTRQTGDLADYTYYFKSIGLPLTLAILARLSIYIFGSTFPRKNSFQGIGTC